jgi:hypothetical protein
MTKQNLFSLISLFFAIALLQCFEIRAGFAYGVWILSIVIVLGLIYGFCKDDPKEDSNLY